MFFQLLILIAVGGSFRCQSDWVKYLDDNFEEVICGGNDETFILENFNLIKHVGLDVALRDKTKENIRRKVKLSPRQNGGVINSLNFAVKQQFGAQRPDPSLCRFG